MSDKKIGAFGWSNCYLFHKKEWGVGCDYYMATKQKGLSLRRGYIYDLFFTMVRLFPVWGCGY
jgi:hypothetical protein